MSGGVVRYLHKGVSEREGLWCHRPDEHQRGRRWIAVIGLPASYPVESQALVEGNGSIIRLANLKKHLADAIPVETPKDYTNQRMPDALAAELRLYRQV